MIDILFLTLPRLELRAPIIAPAILKATVEQHGFKSFCYDLNIELWNSIDKEQYGHVWFDTDLTFRYEDKFDEFWKTVLSEQLKKWILKIKEINPSWIGITIFSQRSKWITIKFCNYIKQELPNVKIVTGGTYSEFLSPWLLENKLIDAYVVGEGEYPLIEILKGNFDYPGINGQLPKQIDNLDNIPLPDYSDFELSKYPKTWFDPRLPSNESSNIIYITGSRGCVRKCTFCDVASLWPKFRYRSGKSIAEEIRKQNQNHGSKMFLFTDSLINGSVKQLIDLCNTLIEYKENNLIDKDVIWQGQFIARSPKHMSEDVYAIMNKAGCYFVSIGIESGSEKIRNDMKKMFSDEDMDFTFRMCAKYNIKMAWLLMVGYPTETEEDFNKTLNLLERYNWINQKGLIKNIALGPTLEILKGSPLWNEQFNMGINWDETKNWYLNNNTKEARINRWLKLKERCEQLNYPIVEKATDHLIAELNTLKNYTPQPLKIYDHYNEGLGSMGPSV